MSLNVFSAFDGISCGQLALVRANIKYDNYYASEVKEDSIKVTQHHFPNTIQVGDIQKVDAKDFPKIDLLIGGSPCQGFSFAGKQLNFNDSRSRLFFEFVRLLKDFQPTYFLLENVKMKKEYSSIITQYMGVDYIEINSSLVSAQNRKRLYWTNIPNITQPEDNGLLIKDIIYDNSYRVYTDERITKTKKITKSGNVRYNLSRKGKNVNSIHDRANFLNQKSFCVLTNYDTNNIVLDYENDIYRRIHPVEAERLQTLPDNYTNIDLSHSKRLQLIGDAWTVDVIAHILRNIK